MMQRILSGTGVSPVRTRTNRRDAGVTKFAAFRLSLLLCTFTAVGAMDPPTQPITLSPEQAIKEGRELVEELLTQVPDANTATGVLQIRRDKKYREIPIKFETIVTATNWISIYEATEPDRTSKLTITHVGTEPGKYGLNWHSAKDSIIPNLHASETTNYNIELNPFVGSDFLFADLGLEFLHWPDQKLLQKEMKRSRSCRVLESTNPHPEHGGYAKVKCWIDNESHGILLAQAFDAKGNKLKEFAPGDFSKSKATGQWQLGKMQITNFQTDSTTTVRFDVDK